MESRPPTPTCRFISSLGGTRHCQDPPSRLGFCAFHFEAFLGGEILPSGQISERVDDQHRRRALNYHGVPAETEDGTADVPQR